LLRQTLLLAILVAWTGILLPIALSFLLIPMFSATISKLAAFAAGASLCSTSLGTTFAVLSAAKLTSTRVGTVLVTAAMLDDVVGLVMVKIISTIGVSLNQTVSAGTIIRPIGVSVGALVAIVLISMFLKRVQLQRLKVPLKAAGFLATGLVILGLSAAAGYAGTSIVFVIYLAGASANYLYDKPAESEPGEEAPAMKCYTKYVLWSC
jgi:Kef-type K+ transport system membrane component KefB